MWWDVDTTKHTQVPMGETTQDSMAHEPEVGVPFVFVFVLLCMRVGGSLWCGEVRCGVVR